MGKHFIRSSPVDDPFKTGVDGYRADHNNRQVFEGLPFRSDGEYYDAYHCHSSDKNARSQKCDTPPNSDSAWWIKGQDSLTEWNIKSFYATGPNEPYEH